ncbi:MAG: AMP-binding protein, partial [Verrucomicrobiota bacterium]
GVQPGDGVLFVHPVSIDLYVALLAVFRMGAVAQFIDPSAKRKVVQQAVKRLSPKAFFGSPKAHLLRLLHPDVGRISLPLAPASWMPGIHWDLRRSGGIEDECLPFPCEKETPGLITFTSGSTGEPKAVVRSHGFLLSQYECLRSSIQLEEGEVDLITLPVFALANLAAGVTSVLADTDLARPGKADGPRIGSQLREENVTRCAASPAFFSALLRQKTEMIGVQKLFTGGAPVFPPLLDQLSAAAPHARIEAVYGSTEAEPIAHVSTDEIESVDREGMKQGRGLLAGMPVTQIRLAILPNEWGNPLGPFSDREFSEACLSPGTVGEIVVSGGHVLKGYLGGRGDEETKFRVDDEVWHRTGDLGRLDDEGRLWLLGRASAVMPGGPNGGEEVYPFAVEAALSFRSEVKRSALIEQEGRRVLVVEWADDVEGAASEDLREDVAWAALDEIVTMAIPMDRRHNAKVDYPALRKCLGKR